MGINPFIKPAAITISAIIKTTFLSSSMLLQKQTPTTTPTRAKIRNTTIPPIQMGLESRGKPLNMAIIELMAVLMVTIRATRTMKIVSSCRIILVF